MKVCKRCSKEKSLSEFTRHSQTKDGFRAWCKDCRADYDREQRATHPDKFKDRNRRITLRKYKLDVAGYDRLLEKQHGVCAICGNGNKGKTFHVDHDHKTGVVRGLLCSSCNMALGLLKDDPNIVLRMFDYLEDNADLPFDEGEFDWKTLMAEIVGGE
jgi:hypothetical protein